MKIDHEQIEKLMQANGIDSLEKLAELSGLSVNTIYKIVRRGHNWKNTSIEAIAKALETSEFSILIPNGQKPRK